jgi:acetone carboxylase alpha subunit
MGECIFALFTPEGEAVCFSTGLLLHVPNQGMAIKWMLRNDYEEKVGINEGDIFFNNDPYIAGTHSPDQMDLLPIFHEGEIVGWGGALNHVPETGAMESGGTSILAQTRFDEGLFLPCLKTAENYQFKYDVEQLIERSIRPSIWWLLDMRARVAGLRIMEEGLKDLIKEYGIDFVMTAIYEYIEDTRQACIKKMQNVLFPGTYHGVQYVDVFTDDLPVRQPLNRILRVPIETTITSEGQAKFDFDGASPAVPFSLNSTLATTNGHIINQLIQMIFYDTKYNQGTFESYESSIPPSTINPPNRTYPTGAWICGVLASSNVVECVSRAYYQMGYREEVCAAPPTLTWLHAGGTDQYGRPLSMSFFQSGFGGMPASGVFDGLDVAYAAYNPEADCTDAEMWEKIAPVTFLGRRIYRDSGGFGKYRGGNALEELIMVDMAESVSLAALGTSSKVFVHHGIMGGYPSVAAYRAYIKNSNLRELIDRQMPLPHSEGVDYTNPDWIKLGVKGELHNVKGNVPETVFKKYDLFHYTNIASGGYGDPIERDPRYVKKDIENDVSVVSTAQEVYKVSIDPDTLEIDYEKTKALRENYREERKKRGIPAQEYIRREREKVLNGNLPPTSKQCLNDSLALSESFLKTFTEFWDLPEGFKRIP